MKFIVLLISIAFIVISCGSNSAKDDTADIVKQDTILNEAKMSVARGEALIKKSDCGSCHKRSTLLIGPSYFGIANKYTEADIEMLSGKIIKGSKGDRGIDMNAHSDLKREDVRDMVRFILTCNQPYDN